MKGDVYDDGTPNPLVVKCPYCGGVEIVEYIGTGSAKYRCKACGKEFSCTCITGEQHIAESPKYGGICPKCGAVMSPKQATCVFCAPTEIGSLYNIPYVNIDYTKAISVTESHYNGRFGDKEGKNDNLERQRY